MAKKDQFQSLRIPEELKREIERTAEDDDRNYNGQVLHLIKEGLKLRTVQHQVYQQFLRTANQEK